MKKVALAICLLGAAVYGHAASNPYVQGFWTPGAALPVTQLTNVSAGNFQYRNTTTAWAPFYHPLSAGSLTRYLPTSLQPFIPPEAWACTIGGGYLATNGGAQLSLGCGANIAASVQAEASTLLEKSSNASLNAFGALIAPNPDGTGLYLQYGWASSGPKILDLAPVWGFGVSIPLG